jgi:hypothetical protein
MHSSARASVCIPEIFIARRVGTPQRTRHTFSCDPSRLISNSVFVVSASGFEYHAALLNTMLHWRHGAPWRRYDGMMSDAPMR